MAAVPKTGSDQRWAPQDDQSLAAAVAEHSGVPNTRYRSGINWDGIVRKALARDYGQALRVRLNGCTRLQAAKKLSKRWWLICPNTTINGVRSRVVR